MRHANDTPLVTTLPERCRVCFTCVRECPAKAIRIVEGQARIIASRCIGCGNCIRVCSQQAKQAVSSIEPVERLLTSGADVAAIVAPSFAAEFSEVNHRMLVGSMRALGFTYVSEVAFGADLVAEVYRALLKKEGHSRWVSSACPAIVSYIEKYHPSLVGCLAPIVSPMIASARVLRHLHGEDLEIVFIGPCIAKKGEAGDTGEIDAVLTFQELRRMFSEHAISWEKATPSDFDPPHSGSGALFPLSRGLLATARLEENLLSTDYIAADGRHNFIQAIEELEANNLKPRLLDVLCCNGCIMGAGMSNNLSMFAHRSRVSRYANERRREIEWNRWLVDVESFSSLDLSRTFEANDQRLSEPSREEVDSILALMGKREAADELNCGACGYDTCREHAAAIVRGLAEKRMCLPYTIDRLSKTVKELAESHQQLENAQEQLMHSEKLASMGQLAAGIAHEVNNPLGVVLMYTHLLLDECAADAGFRGDLTVIAEQADRCKKIVQGLLDFARQNQVVRLPVDIRKVLEQGLKTVPKPDGVEITIEHDIADPVAELDHDQIIQIVTNLVSNAYTAMPNGGRLRVRSSGDGQKVFIEVSDTGIGIPRENLKKVFTPFFTTKQIGKGTGLGLAVVHGIVKMHRGDISVESNADPAFGATGTTFKVALPRGSA